MEISKASEMMILREIKYLEGSGDIEIASEARDEDLEGF
jgi:hypothetical protein